MEKALEKQTKKATPKKQKIKAPDNEIKSSSRKMTPRTSYKQMLDMKFKKTLQSQMLKKSLKKDVRAQVEIQALFEKKQKYFNLGEEPQELIETNQFNGIQLDFYKSDSLTQSKIEAKFKDKEFDLL